MIRTFVALGFWGVCFGGFEKELKGTPTEWGVSGTNDHASNETGAGLDTLGRAKHESMTSQADTPLNKWMQDMLLPRLALRRQ